MKDKDSMCPSCGVKYVPYLHKGHWHCAECLHISDSGDSGDSKSSTDVLNERGKLNRTSTPQQYRDRLRRDTCYPNARNMIALSKGVIWLGLVFYVLFIIFNRVESSADGAMSSRTFDFGILVPFLFYGVFMVLSFAAIEAAECAFDMADSTLRKDKDL